MRLRSNTRLAIIITLAMAIGACGDDAAAVGGASSGTNSSGATVGSSGSTRGSATGGSATGEPSTGGSTDTSGGTTGTGAATTSSGATGDTSTGDATTGSNSVDVPFTVLDPAGLPLEVRVNAGWTAVTTEAQWDALTGVAVPAGVSFPQQWLLVGSRGPQPFPGSRMDVSELSWDGGTLAVAGSAVDPAADCETFTFTWPADTLLVIDALDGEVAVFDDQSAAVTASCAAGGGAFADCDLDSPCATGLLCGGLIRTTVLINMPGGLCLSASNAGVFAGGGFMIAGGGATSEGIIDANGLATVDMDVVVWVELDHPAPQELVIELLNPDGNQVPVANLQTSALHPGGVGIVPTGFSGDESVNGVWSLVVTDTVDNANTGAVTSWSLEIMSRLD